MKLIIALICATLGCSGNAARPTLPPAGLARVLALGGPKEFASVFGRLDSGLSAGQRDTLRRTHPDSSGLYHMPLGAWLRIEVILGDTTLNQYMDSHRIRQPEDMSDLLLQAYEAYLQGTQIDVPAIIARIPPPPTGFVRLPAPTH